MVSVRQPRTSINTTKRRQRKHRQHRSERKHRDERPTIRFTPYAWAKLLFLRDCGDTEVSAFAVSAADDLLRIEDVRLVRQQCTPASTLFTDDAVDDLQIELQPTLHQSDQCGRIWIHTHPGECAEPSAMDEETFEQSFGDVDWSLMFILAANGEVYARLQLHRPPACSRRLNVEVDYSREFRPSDFPGWQAEYDRCLETLDPMQLPLDHESRLPIRRADYGHPDAQVRAAVASEWLAHCDAVDLFQDD